MKSASLVAGVSSAIVLALAPATASAALSSAGPVDPDTGFPAYYVDSNGLALEPCVGGANCTAPAGALAIVGSEANYWGASSLMTSPIGTGRRLRLDLALIATRTASGPTTFSRIRFRADSGALQPGGVYTVTEPFGTDTFTADATGGVSTTAGTQDGDALNGRIGPFLSWDPAVAPAPPAGYIGDNVTPHKVTGSPNGKNSFTVAGPGLPQAGVSSDQFVVEGRKATRFPKITVAPSPLDFGSVKVGASSSKTLTVTSAGALALTVTGASISKNSLFGEYSITGDTCSGHVIAPAATCAITVKYAPGFIFSDGAQMTITSNALGQPTTVVPITGAGSLL